MTDTAQITAPILGEPGQPCRECGAPLAADQRFCLECGTRRSEPRVDFERWLRQAPVPATEPAVMTAGPGPARGGATVLAGVATLVLAVGVGVLIGREGHGSQATAVSAPAPQVITVDAGGAGGPAAPSAGAGSTLAARHHAKAAHAAARPSKAANPAISKLQSLATKAYQKQSQKLPKTVGTGGAPPPKDHKAPAGGGSFQSIG